jgi:hypothetical protein
MRIEVISCASIWMDYAVAASRVLYRIHQKLFGYNKWQRRHVWFMRGNTDALGQ